MRDERGGRRAIEKARESEKEGGAEGPKGERPFLSFFPLFLVAVGSVESLQCH